MTTFHTRRRVEFADTDCAGIMHFARFFVFMEEVEHEFLRSRGLSVVIEHDGQRIGFPRVAAQCEFLKPAFFEDVLEVEMTLARVGSRSLTYQHRFHRNGETLARGEITVCCCRVGPPEGVVAVDLPEPIRRQLSDAPATD